MKEKEPLDQDAANRRRVVMQLRIAGYADSEIAVALGVPVTVVLEDIVAAGRELGAQFVPGIDPAREVADALALFLYLETAAKRALLRLEGTPGAPPGDRLKCIKSAADLRLSRLALLSRVGLLGDLSPGSRPMTVDDAETIRKRLQEAGRLLKVDLFAEVEPEYRRALREGRSGDK